MRKLTNYISKSLISSDDLKIYYEISIPAHSNGKNIIFLHGLGGNVTAWDEERIKFGDLGFVTIASDLRGHGLSQKVNSEDYYSIDKFALDILEIIKRENLKDITIVGHCLGGIIALTLEALYSKTAKAIVLVDTTYKLKVESNIVADHKLINKFFILLSKYAPEIGAKKHADSTKFIGTGDINIPRFLSDVYHTSLKNYFRIYKKFLSYDATNALSKITVPTLIIEGVNDSIVPPEIALNLHKMIKTSELKFIEGANHIIVINNPDELVEVIYDFLKKIYFGQKVG